MSTIKHTPTPWIMNGRLIQGPKLNFIASTSHCGQEQNEANAKFMVCACNNFEQLLAALRHIAEADQPRCPRCEGNGGLWADGKPHHPLGQGHIIPCGNCGGSGYLQPENAKEIARAALAAAEVKE